MSAGLSDREARTRDLGREPAGGDRVVTADPRSADGSGVGDGFESDVVYAVDGSRVAVLLLNCKTLGETGYARAAAAANSLYCAG